MDNTEIKIFGEFKIGNRYVKVFVEPDVEELEARKAIDNFIEKYENDKILDENGKSKKGEQIDFLIIQKGSILTSQKNNNNEEPGVYYRHLSNVELEQFNKPLETIITGANPEISWKYTIPFETDFYTFN